MKMDDLFPSKYLKASDADPALTLTIDRVTQEVMKNRDDQDETKAVVYFREAPKPMVLNRTNAKTIANLCGDDTDDWIGWRVVLTTALVDAFGQSQLALRIDPKKPAAEAGF